MLLSISSRSSLSPDKTQIIIHLWQHFNEAVINTLEAFQLPVDIEFYILTFNDFRGRQLRQKSHIFSGYSAKQLYFTYKMAAETFYI
jgi:hypothetical protein